MKYDPDKGYCKDKHGKSMEISRTITYVLTGGQFGIEAGYVVLGLGEMKPHT